MTDERPSRESKCLDDVLAVQCSNGNWNYDAYMMGLANGMILAKHIVTRAKGVPPYKEKPRRWLSENKFVGKPIASNPTPKRRRDAK